MKTTRGRIFGAFPFLAALICALLLLSVNAAAEENLKKASFLPAWLPQAQFAGYYVAFEKGFYRDHGIDLTIIPGGPSRPSDWYLEQGLTEFSILWLPRGIQMRAQGQPVVNLAQIVQRSGLMLVAKKKSGIRTPKELEGKKVSIWGGGFQIQPYALFRKYGVSVKTIPQSSSVNLFLRGGVDAVSAMWYNEYHTILNSGLNPEELTTFFFNEFDLNFPEDGIYTLERVYKKDPALCCGFVQASLEGWRYAFAHESEAIDIIIDHRRKMGLPASRAHQEWMLEKIKELIEPYDLAARRIGVLSETDYERVSASLVKENMIETTPAFTSFYKSCHDDIQK